MKRPVSCKSSKRIRVTISLEENVFIDSGMFISNLSGFINKTLKEYIDYKKNELEKDQKTIDRSSSHNNLLCKIENENDNDYYNEYKKIASIPWTREY